MAACHRADRLFEGSRIPESAEGSDRSVIFIRKRDGKFRDTDVYCGGQSGSVAELSSITPVDAVGEARVGPEERPPLPSSRYSAHYGTARAHIRNHTCGIRILFKHLMNLRGIHSIRFSKSNRQTPCNAAESEPEPILAHRQSVQHAVHPHRSADPNRARKSSLNSKQDSKVTCTTNAGTQRRITCSARWGPPKIKETIEVIQVPVQLQVQVMCRSFVDSV